MQNKCCCLLFRLVLVLPTRITTLEREDENWVAREKQIFRAAFQKWGHLTPANFLGINIGYIKR